MSLPFGRGRRARSNVDSTRDSTRSASHWRRLRLLGVVAMPLLWACEGTTDPVLVGSVNLATVDTILTVGNTVQLTATVLSTTGSTLPGHPVTWSSSEPSAATVSTGGLLTAVGPGTATITAKSEDRSASLRFRVSPGPCTGATAGSIAVGGSGTGTLDGTDCTLDYFRAEGWTLQLPSTTGIRIVMTSGSFSPQLVLTDLNHNPVLWGNLHPDGVQLMGEVPAGSYIIWASGYDYSNDQVSGTYQLSVSEVEFCSSAEATTPIGPGDTHSGVLESGDCVFFHDGVADGFHLDLAATTGVQIDLSSTAFDGVLILTDADMNLLAWDDDGAADLDARIQRRLAAGEYFIWTTSAWPDGSGAYELSVAEVEIELCPVAGDLGLGEAVSGTLSSGDCEAQARYADPWTLSLAEETTVRIDLTSVQLDTYLTVEDELGAILLWDDDGGEGLNSRIEHTFPAGEYRVVATSYAPGEVGSYQLSAQEMTSVGGTALMRASPPHTAPWLKARRQD